MIIELEKDLCTNELRVKFTLKNNHFLILNAEEITAKQIRFAFEIENETIFQEWLSNKINKETVDPAYYEPKGGST